MFGVQGLGVIGLKLSFVDFESYRRVCVSLHKRVCGLKNGVSNC